VPEIFALHADRLRDAYERGHAAADAVQAEWEAAAERAAVAADRLNAAAQPLRTTVGLTLEARGVESNPVIGLVGRPEALLEVTEEDGTVHHIGAGDVLITPRGSKATWKALSAVKKFWAVYKE